jgi:hypothetical protein
MKSKRRVVYQYQDGGVLTPANSPDFFNNKARFSDDDREDKRIKKLILTGWWGIDSNTNKLVKLEKKVEVPQEYKDLSSKNWENTKTGKELKKEGREIQEYNRLQESYQNPMMQAPGIIGLGAGAIGAARAAGLNLPNVLNTPLNVAGRTIPGVTPASISSAAGVGYFGPTNVMEGVENIQRGDYNTAALNLIEAGLDFYAPEMLKNPSKIISKVPKKGGAALDMSEYIVDHANNTLTIQDANNDARIFSESPYNRLKLKNYRPNQNFEVSNTNALYNDDPIAQESFKRLKRDDLDFKDYKNINEFISNKEGRYASRDFKDLDDLAVVNRDSPLDKHYLAAIHETGHSRSVRLPATEEERRIIDKAWKGLKDSDGDPLDLLEGEAVQGELRMLLGDKDGSRIYTEKDIPQVKKALEKLKETNHPYIQNVDDFDIPSIIESLNKIGLAGFIPATVVSNQEETTYQQGGKINEMKSKKYQEGGKTKPKRVVVFSETPKTNWNRIPLNQLPPEIRGKIEEFNRLYEELSYIDNYSIEEAPNEKTNYLTQRVNQLYNEIERMVPKEFIDDTFLKVADQYKKWGKANGVKVEIRSGYGSDDVYSKLDDLSNDDTFIYLGHAGSKIAGVDMEDWDKFISSKNPKECIGGTCNEHDGMGGRLPNVNNYSTAYKQKWLGPDMSKIDKELKDFTFGLIQDEKTGKIKSSKPRYTTRRIVDGKTVIDKIGYQQGGYLTEGPMYEYQEGGIPDRYKEMGFSKVGQKKKSTRDGKKWMVLAKKGDDYKVVHGGDSNMDDYSQHGSDERKERFWDRMGGRDSAKANDSFSPLYWHKKFGTWQNGGRLPFKKGSLDTLMQNNQWRNWSPTEFNMPQGLQNLMPGFNPNQYNDMFSQQQEQFKNFSTNWKEWANQQGYRQVEADRWKSKDGVIYNSQEISNMWKSAYDKNTADAQSFQQGTQYAPIMSGLMQLNEMERDSAAAAEQFDYLGKTRNPMSQNRGNFFAQQGMAIANALRQLPLEDLQDMQRSQIMYNGEEGPAIVNRKTKQVLSRQPMQGQEKGKVTVLMINGQPMEVLLKEDGDFTILGAASKDYLKGYKYQQGGYNLRKATGTPLEEEKGFSWLMPVGDKNPENYSKEKVLYEGRPVTALIDPTTGDIVAIGETDKRYSSNPEIKREKMGMEEGGRVKAESEKGDKWEYEYDPQSDQWYVKNESKGKKDWIKVKSGSEADKAIRNRYPFSKAGTQTEKYESVLPEEIPYQGMGATASTLSGDSSAYSIPPTKPMYLGYTGMEEEPIRPMAPQENNYYEQIGKEPLLEVQSSEASGQSYDNRIPNLLQLIGRAESDNRPGAAFGKKGEDPNLTNMTIKEVREYQEKLLEEQRKKGRKQGSLSSAVGEYQFLGNTIDDLLKNKKIKETDIFNKDVQDKMAIELMRRRGLDNYLSGSIDANTFADNLSKEWAALPYNTGSSYYDKRAGNKSRLSREDFLSTLDYPKQDGGIVAFLVKPSVINRLKRSNRKADGIGTNNENSKHLIYTPSDSDDDEISRLYQQGGMTQQRMGYKDESPYRNRPFQYFDTDTLTMEGVSRPILAIADNGMTEVMQPNSGEYTFPGARRVMEVPMAQQGGLNSAGERFRGTFDKVREDSASMVNGVVDEMTKIIQTDSGDNTATELRPLIYDALFNQLPFDQVAQELRARGIDENKIKNLYSHGSRAVQNYNSTFEVDEPTKISNILINRQEKTARLGTKSKEVLNVLQEQGGMAGSVSGIYGGMNPLVMRKKKDPVLPFIDFTNAKNAIPNLPNIFREGGLITQWNNSGRAANSPTASRMKLPGSTGGRVLPIKSIVNEQGYIPQGALTPIQAEIDEMIIHPTGDITPVAAKKRHSRMPEDMVTDMAPEGSYVVSAHGNVDIRKADASQIITERSMEPYRLEGSTPIPTQKTLADIMKRGMEKPAEIVKRIDNKFPVIPAKNPFEVAANDQNKMSRLPYLQGVILLSEIERELNEQSMPQYMKAGGIVRRNNLPKAFYGALISGIFGAIGAGQQRAEQNRLLQQYRERTDKDITGLERDRTNFLGAEAAVAASSIMAQDPNVRWKDLQALSMYRPGIANAQVQALNDAAYRNRPNLSSNMSPQSAMYAANAGYAAAMDASSKAALEAYARDEESRIKDLINRQSILNQNTVGRTDAINKSVLGRNQMLSQVGRVGEHYFRNRGNLRTDIFNARNAMENSIMQQKFGQGNIFTDFQGAAGAVGGIIDSAKGGG